MSEERYALWWGQHGPEVRPASDGCRDYECCGGTECGSDLDDIKRELVKWHEAKIKEIKALTDETVLTSYGCCCG